MEVLFILIAISIVVAAGFLVTFLMNMNKGQFDDMYTPSVRILFENQKPKTNDIADELDKASKSAK